MHGIKKKIMKLFCEDVEVYIEDEHFVFRRGKHVNRFEPFIYLLNDPKAQIEGPSGENTAMESHAIIRPFSKDDIGHPGISRKEAIEAFIARGFTSVTKRMYLALPDVYFYGVERLERAIQGFDRSMLSDGAHAAGARKCVFVENKKLNLGQS